MQPSENCLKLVKHYEKFMPNPYLCPAGVPTIGYGTTVYPNGQKVRLTDKTITEPLACEYLGHDVEQTSAKVLLLLKVQVSQGLFDGLVSFAYNVGTGALERSTLLKEVNRFATGRTITVEFMKWTKAKQGGKLVVLPGLVARRTCESYLSITGQLKFFTA